MNNKERKKEYYINNKDKINRIQRENRERENNLN
jgi:hypothetical protein